MHASPILLSFLLAASLTACADTGPRDFDRRMASYISAPEADLVSGLGVPRQIYEADGRRFLQYDFGGWRSLASGGPSFGIGVGGARWSGGSGVGTGLGIGFGGSPQPQYVACVVTFEIRDRHVLDFHRQGDGCR